MQLHAKKRLEFIVEAPALEIVCDKLDRLGVQGYTAFPASMGRGRGGRWTEAGAITDTGQMVMLVCILDAARLDEVLDGVFGIVRRQIGIVTVSDVEVVRAERF